MRLRHHPRYHGMIHGMAKVIELVEDMRPFVHIFFIDIFPPIVAMCVVSGVFHAIRNSH